MLLCCALMNYIEMYRQDLNMSLTKNRNYLNRIGFMIFLVISGLSFLYFMDLTF